MLSKIYLLILIGAIFYIVKREMKIAREESYINNTPEETDDSESEKPANYIPDFKIDWSDFIGGGYAKNILKRKADIFHLIGKIPEHFLLSAKGGMGKTMLVKIFASKMGINFIEVPADSLKEDTDFYNLMDKITDKTILFFEECQCLDKKILANHVYRLMEDNAYLKDNRLIDLPDVCIIGATTDIEKFEPSFMSRFKSKVEIEDYNHQEMGKIVQNKSIIEMVESDGNKIGIEISKRSFGIPRLAIGHLKSIEEIAIIEGNPISLKTCSRYFNEVGIDKNGLNKKHLKTIDFFKRNNNQPVSIKRLSIAMGFNRQKTFEHEIEIPLTMLGLITSTSRGRCLTEIGLKYLD